ncbi:subtilisin-like protein [Ascobolus immersus RN42]|uniref:Subtilisin-like protein n=1 Tax=Ascobolus immersus RN42 TaxID=1160509 RepID=A0A3N4HR15_ASCIM|nr:subtilisin-like protein [Ascobolus immersus RN42]
MICIAFIFDKLSSFRDVTSAAKEVSLDALDIAKLLAKALPFALSTPRFSKKYIFGLNADGFGRFLNQHLTPCEKGAGRYQLLYWRLVTLILWCSLLGCAVSLPTGTGNAVKMNNNLNEGAICTAVPDLAVVGDYWEIFHGRTGITDLHKNGYLGAGVAIAVIDHAIDLTHPGFGTGRCTDSYNFITNNTNVQPHVNATFSHGTNVALAAVACDTVLRGTAPSASILAYQGGTVAQEPSDSQFHKFNLESLSHLETVINRALNYSAKVISLSSGSTRSWASGAIQSFLAGISKRALILASATNQGFDTAFRQTIFSSTNEVIGVGNYDSGLIPAYRIAAVENVDGQESSRNMFYIYGSPPQKVKRLNLHVFLLENDEKTDVCEPFPWPLSFKSSDLLLLYASRFDKECLEKIGGFYDRGATGMFLWTDNGLKDFIQDSPQGLKGGRYREKAFGYLPGLVPSSGPGPTYDLRFGVNIIGPGENHLTGGLHHQYVTSSGTSLATPNIAGSAALIIAADELHRLTEDPDYYSALRSRIITSGNPILASSSYRHNGDQRAVIYEPSWRQAAGLFNGTLAMSRKLGIWPPFLELSDDDHLFAKKQTLRLKNNSSKHTIILRHLQGPGQLMVDNTAAYPAIAYLFQMPLDIEMKAEIIFSTFEVTLEPDEEVSVSLDFTTPEVEENLRRQLPLYGGWVQIDNDEGDTYTVAYFGAACSMKRDLELWLTPPKIIFSTAADGIFALSDDSIVQLPTQVQDEHYTVMINLALGSAHVRADYVEADWNPSSEADEWKYPPETGKNGFVASAYRCSEENAERLGPGYGGTCDPPFGSIHLDGWIGDGDKFLPPGQYRLRVMILKIFGDKSVEDDWVLWTSPIVFEVRGED